MEKESEIVILSLKLRITISASFSVMYFKVLPYIIYVQ